MAVKAKGEAAGVMLKAALTYAEKFHFSVFPCRRRGKEPLNRHGLKEASTDAAAIRAWWKRWPRANVGIATGTASGIVVLDVDLKADGRQTLAILEDEQGRLPETPTVLTGGGGQHLYFRDPGGLRNSAGRLGAGLDVRADGGYVIAPPSIHPNGNKYRWESSSRIDEVELSEVPPWLLERMKPEDAERFELPAKVGEGKRNDTLYHLGRSLRARGLAEPEIMATLTAANGQRCDPPLPAREVAQIAHSAATQPDRPDFAQMRDGAPLSSSDAQAQWPKPLKEAAYHGAAGDFVKLVEPNTEADPAALLVQFLIGFGNLCGPAPYRFAGGVAHHLNEYAVIVGDTSRSRKGTSWAEVERFLDKVDCDWTKHCGASGLSTGEGLIWHVRDPQPADDRGKGESSERDGHNSRVPDPGATDKRLMVQAGEFAAVLKVATRDGATLSPVLREAWDGKVLRTLSKNNPATASGAHVSITAHITHEELVRGLDSTEIANGFANRFA